MNVRGITLADWTPDGYALPAALSAIEDIAAVGANSVVIVVTAYQAGESASEVLADPRRTPTETSVELAVGRARTAGLRVIIKPHVDLDTGEWRGKISPNDPGAWFESYRAFIDPWAEFAQAQGVSQFVVGTELAGTISYEADWRSLIDGLRSRFSGQLVYAASWDEARLVPFWDALDRVGVDFYAPVTTRRDPGRLEILVGWQHWLERLHLLYKQTNRPIVLTEIGYRSVDGAGLNPFEFGSFSPPDPGEQADLYWAAMQAVGDKSWIEGLYWWNWLADGTGGMGNTDFTPKGKPAQGELSSAWKR